MNHRIRAIVVLLALLSLTFGSLGPVSGQQAPSPLSFPALQSEFKSGELLVKLRDRVSSAAVQEIQAQYGAASLRTLAGGQAELWSVAAGQELETVARLNADPAVEYAEPNWKYYALGTPNDPRYGEQWPHSKVNAPQGWDITTGSAEVIIAIIDTGIDEGHPDLAAKIVGGYDYVDYDSNPHDGNGHGTHCAGIAAAITNNALGVAGMNWQARIMPVRVLDDTGSGWASDIISGIYWAYQNGADVLSLSLGGTGYDQFMQDAVNAAHNAGSLVVAAMGNARTEGNPTSYPAAYNNVMAVAATNPYDTYAYYSQFGSHVDIAAPGGEMSYLHDPDGFLSTLPTYNNFYLHTDPIHGGFSLNYDYLQGTSMATPYVAGLAALIWSLDPTLTPDQVQQTIQDTAVDLGPPGWDANYGWGRIDVQAALLSRAVTSTPSLLPITNAGGAGDYTVDWTDAILATGYVLQEDDNASFTSPLQRYSGPNSQTYISNQAPGTWYYRVIASGPFGDSGWSNVGAVSVRPDPPVLATINNGGQADDYLVAWSASATATSYVLEEDTDPGFGSPTTRYMGAATQYHVTGQSDATWHYRVRAASGAGTSGPSNVRSTVVAALPLDAPSLGAIDNADGDSAYLVNWSDVAGATSYTLEQSATPYFEAPQEIYSGSLSEHNVGGQSSGTWYYRVRAFGGGSDSGPWSNSRAAIVPTFIYLPVLVR
ncbi:MAG: S8 family peptidase [Anaerolineae bacterium]